LNGEDYRLETSIQYMTLMCEQGVDFKLLLIQAAEANSHKDTKESFTL